MNKKLLDITSKDLESKAHVCLRSFRNAHLVPSLRLAIIVYGVGHSTWLSQATDKFATSQASDMSAQATLDRGRDSSSWYVDGEVSNVPPSNACFPTRRAHMANTPWAELPSLDRTSTPTRDKCSFVGAALHGWVRARAEFRQREIEETAALHPRACSCTHNWWTSRGFILPTSHTTGNPTSRTAIAKASEFRMQAPIFRYAGRYKALSHAHDLSVELSLTTARGYRLPQAAREHHARPLLHWWFRVWLGILPPSRCRSRLSPGQTFLGRVSSSDSKGEPSNAE